MLWARLLVKLEKFLLELKSMHNVSYEITLTGSKSVSGRGGPPSVKRLFSVHIFSKDVDGDAHTVFLRKYGGLTEDAVSQAIGDIEDVYLKNRVGTSAAEATLLGL